MGLICNTKSFFFLGFHNLSIIYAVPIPAMSYAKSYFENPSPPHLPYFSQGNNASIISLVKDTALRSINPNLIIDDDSKIILFTFFILIVFTHKKNISNLKNKTESKIKI